MQWASRRWFVAFDKSLTQNIRAIRCCQLAAQRVDFDDLDTGRGDEIGNWRPGSGELHELRPDGECRLSARKTQLRLVVETNPNYSQQIRGITDKPSVFVVVSCSRLAGGWTCKPPSPGCIRRAAVEDSLQKIVHDK